MCYCAGRQNTDTCTLDNPEVQTMVMNNSVLTMVLHKADDPESGNQTYSLFSEVKMNPECLYQSEMMTI